MYVIAEDENHRSYSNCSSFQFDIQKVYESAFETRVELNSYGTLLNDLEILSNNYNSFRKIFQPTASQKKSLDIENYQSYINLEEINIETFSEILKFYNNHGVCSKVKIFANYPSELTTKVISPVINSNIQSNLFQIRFVEKFKIIQPNIELLSSNDEPEIILAPESSFEWVLEGGPNIWEETRKINEIYEVEDRSTGKITSNHYLTIKSLSKYQGQKIKRHYYTECNLPKDDKKISRLYSIKLFSWNEPDTKLIKPVNISVMLNVSCKIPSKLQIYNFDPYETPINVYKAKIFGFEAVNLKNYAEHYFQVFAYDEKLFPFYNFSSLKVNWRITKPTNSILQNAMYY